MRQLILILIILMGNNILAQQAIWYVESIKFSGNNNIDRKELLSIMQLQPPGFFTRSTYSFTELTDDILRIEQFYDRIGYLNANVNIGSVDRDSTVNGVSIRLRVNESTQTIIDSIIIKSNTVFSDSVLLAIIPLKINAPLDSLFFAQSDRTIQDSLASRGLLFSKVDKKIKFNKDRSKATIIYTINEGPVILLGNIEIIGTDAIRRKVIKRELVLNENAVLTSTEISRFVRRLYSTGLFDYVRIEPIDTFSDPDDYDTVKVPLLVQIQLADMFSIQTGGGYNTDDGFYGTLELSYNNLFSLGHRISISSRLSYDLRGAQITYSYPRVFDLPLFGDLMLYIEDRDELEFSGLFIGGLLALSGSINSQNRYSTWLRVENTASIEGPPPSLDFPEYLRSNIVLLGLGFTHDTRDNLIEPGSGIFGLIETEIAGFGISWTENFFKIEGDIRTYFSIFDRRIFFASALYTGYVTQYGGADNVVPPQDLFRAGEEGIRPVRGYEEESVTIIDENGIARGGKLAMIVTPLEVTFPLFPFVKGAVFIDGGFIWPTAQSFGLQDLKWAIGPGLRLYLPVGIARLDYGIRLDGDFDLDGRIHFGIGTAF